MLGFPGLDAGRQEQDVCAFGVTAQAVMSNYTKQVCTACGGQGSCI